MTDDPELDDYRLLFDAYALLRLRSDVMRACRADALEAVEELEAARDRAQAAYRAFRIATRRAEVSAVYFARARDRMKGTTDGEDHPWWEAQDERAEGDADHASDPG